MPLPAGLTSYIAELKAYDLKPLPTPADAARAFAKAFANFFGFAGLDSVPILPTTNLLPSAVQAMTEVLVPAFTAPKDPASSCLLMQQAFIAYWNAAPISAMWPTATAVAPVAPQLADILVASMVPPLPGAKAKLANGIMQWVTSGVDVTLSTSPDPFKFQ